jgi:hypothetical protein
MRAKTGSQQKPQNLALLMYSVTVSPPFLAHPEFSCKILVQRIFQSFS